MGQDTRPPTASDGWQVDEADGTEPGTTDSAPVERWPDRAFRAIGRLGLRTVGMVTSGVAAALLVAFLVTRPLGGTGPVGAIDPNAFYRVAAEQEGLQVGQRAPDFVGRVDDQNVRLTDLGGKPLSIAKLRGRPLWINFWATWCPPCQRETPDLRAAFEAHRGDGLVLVSISIQEPADIVREYVTRYGLTYTIGLDTSAAIMRTYGVYGLPTHYFVDRDGVIRDRYYGPLSRQQIEERLSLIMPTLPGSTP